MKPLYDGHESYYKRMLDLQEQLRKSEEERIRLEERFNHLVRESRSRHRECINRLRMRYVEYLEEQRLRDERNSRLLGSLDKIDTSLALMSAKTERLNTLRKQYEAHLLRTYGSNRQRPSGSVTADSGLESQHDQEIPAASPVFLASKHHMMRPSTKSPVDYRATTRVPEMPITNYKLPSFSWLSESSCEIARRTAALPSSYNTSYRIPDVQHEDSSDCLLRDLAMRPEKTTTIVDPVSTAERNLEQYLNQLKQMHKDVDNKSEQSADEAEQNTSGDLLNVSLSEDNVESVAEEETTKERLRLKFARQAFANPRALFASGTPPNSFETKAIEEPPQKFASSPEPIVSFRDRLRRSELMSSRRKIDDAEPKIVEESTKFTSETISPVREQRPSSTEETPTKLPTFSETMSSFRERFKRLEPNETKPIITEEAPRAPTFAETMSSFKDRFRRTDSTEPKDDATTKSPTFSESIGSLREKFNRTDFVNSRDKPITPDSFEDAFAKLTRMKEQPRRTEPQETPAAPVITEELPTPPAEEEAEKESSSSEVENDGIEDDYDETVDIDTWMPDDVEPEPQEAKRKDDILDLPRRKLESIEEVEHAEDEEIEEEEEEKIAEIDDAKDGEAEEDDEKENVEPKDIQELEEHQPKQEESSKVAHEIQEQVADPNAPYEGQEQQYADQHQYYEQDASVQQQYYEQGDPQQYQYSEDPNQQQYAYDPNAQYAGYEGQYAGYEGYQQYDPSQYDPSQYDPNQYPEYAGYQQQEIDQSAAAQYDPNQASYDYSQAYPENDDYQQATAEEQQQQIDAAAESSVAASQVVDEQQQQQQPKKKKDAIKAILDSDSESFIERNLSNTESDFDFN